MNEIVDGVLYLHFMKFPKVCFDLNTQHSYCNYSSQVTIDFEILMELN